MSLKTETQRQVMQINQTLRRLLGAGSAVAALALAPVSHAQVSNYWNSTISGDDFNTAGNWVDAFTAGGPGAVPGVNGIAVFSSSGTGAPALATNSVLINSDVSFGRLLITTNGFAGSGNNPPAWRFGGTGLVTLNGDGTGSAAGGEVVTVNLHANALNPVISNNINIALAGGRISVNGGRTLTLSGNIGGAGTQLITTNTGTVRLTGSNLFNGIRMGAAGTVNVNAGAGLGIAPGAFTADSIALWNGSTLTINTNGTVTSGNTDGGNFTINSNMGITVGHTAAGAATININNGTVSILTDDQIRGFAGTTVGTNRLQKSGGGTLVLGGSQSLLNAHRIVAGTLQVNGDAALGTAPAVATHDAIQITNGTLALNFNGELNANRGIAIGFTNNTGAVTWNAGISVLGATNVVTYNGIISNAWVLGGLAPVADRTGNLIKQGPGTLNLGGGNGQHKYSGITRIDAGYLTETSVQYLPTGSQIVYNGGGLRVGADYTITDPNIVIGSNNNARAVFNVESGATLTFNGGVINNHTNAAGANNIISKNGLGTMILGGNLNHFGGVESSNGVLVLSGANTYNGISQTLAAGARISVSSLGNLGTNLFVMNNGGILATEDITFGSANTLFRLGNSNNANGGVFEVASGKTLTINSSIFQNNTNGVSAGGIEKQGLGTLVLGNTNAFAGTTTVRDGTLSVTINEALGQLSEGFNVLLATNLSGKVSGVGTNFTISKGSFILNGTTQTVRDVNFTDNNAASTASSTATISGGDLMLQGNINYTGGQTNLLGQRETGASTLSANLQLMNNNKTITVNDSINTTEELTISGTITGYADDDVTTGLRNITKAGLGTLVLNTTPGANSWSNTTVTGGTLKLANDEQLPNAGSLTVNNATFDLNGRTETLGNVGGVGNGLVVGGAAGNSLVTLGGGVLTNLGNLSYSATGNPGTALIGNGTYSFGARNQTMTIGNSTNTTEELVISATLTSDNNNRTLAKAGLGTLVLSNASLIAPNTNGGLTINNEGGIVKLGIGEQIPNNRTLTINGTTNFTTQDTYFDLNGMIETVGGLTMGATNSFANSHVRESLLQDVAGGGQLVLNGNITFVAGPAGDTFQSGKATVTANVDLGSANRIANIANSTNTGVDMRISGNISGVGRTLTVTNTGTLQLAGANTFASLVVSNGATVLNDGSHSGAATVGPAGTLGGTGTIAGAVSVLAGGVLAPGNSPGTLTVGNLTLADGAGLNFELDVQGLVGGLGNNDLLSVVGNLTLDGSLNIDGLANFGTGIYRLINYTGTLTDNGLDIGALNGTAGSFAGNLSIDTATIGQVNLIVGVPEPSTVALAGIGAALLGLHVIRRRRNS